MLKLGLVFAGGGGKGAYQIGVWKALRETGRRGLFRRMAECGFQRAAGDGRREPGQADGAGVQAAGLSDPKIRLKIQQTLSHAFGAVCSGIGCFPDRSAPMPPSAPGVVWVTIWV